VPSARAKTAGFTVFDMSLADNGTEHFQPVGTSMISDFGSFASRRTKPAALKRHGPPSQTPQPVPS